MNLIEALEQLQKKYNYGQVQLAEYLGLSQPFISSLKKGERKAGIETYVKVANALDLPVDMIIDDILGIETKRRKNDMLRINIKKIIGSRSLTEFVTDVNIKTGKTFSTGGMTLPEIDEFMKGHEDLDPKLVELIAKAEGITAEQIYKEPVRNDCTSLPKKIKDFISTKENIIVIEKVIEAFETYKKVDLKKI